MKYCHTLILTALLSSCISLNNKRSSDYQYNIDYKQYGSYTISSDVTLPLKTEEAISDIIHVRMNALGFSHCNKNADLVVFYKVYYDPEGTIVYGLTTTGLDGISSRRINRKSRLKGKILYFSLLDRNSGQVIWRGYSKNFDPAPFRAKADAYAILDSFNPVIHFKNTF